MENYLQILASEGLARTGPARLVLIHGHRRQGGWTTWNFLRRINALCQE
nr:MAG TPA: hypothetical protein [Caudoviricetes sp.]